MSDRLLTTRAVAERLGSGNQLVGERVPFLVLGSIALELRRVALELSVAALVFGSCLVALFRPSLRSGVMSRRGLLVPRSRLAVPRRSLLCHREDPNWSRSGSGRADSGLRSQPLADEHPLRGKLAGAENARFRCLGSDPRFNCLGSDNSRGVLRALARDVRLVVTSLKHVIHPFVACREGVTRNADRGLVFD